MIPRTIAIVEPDLPLIAIVPKSMIRTGMTIAEARELPGVVVFCAGDIERTYGRHAAEAAMGKPPVICVAEEVAWIPETPAPKLPLPSLIIPHAPKYKPPSPPKMSRHDRNPRKGRR